MKKRVVITGMDVATSIGTGLETFWQAAIAGKSGVQRVQLFNPEPYPTQIAGEIRDLSLESLPEFSKPKRFPRVTQYALHCAHYAIMQSGLTAEELKTAGTFIGTSLGGTPELEAGYGFFFEGAWKKIPALSILRGMPNAIANHVAIAFGIQGPNSTISNACVSSADAVGLAYQHIAHGRLNVAVCGGAESLLWESVMSGWCKLRVMSTRNDEPARACRPFDQTRDGMVMADGAGILTIESLEHAKARGASIYAEIIGFGASCDAYHITAPSSDGQVRAILASLDDAKLSPNDIHYINAHGTGTLLNDATETQTIKTVFGDHATNIPITAQKSMTGHAIGAAGAIELIATAMSLKHQVALPTINLEHPDPLCDLDYVPHTARNCRMDLALSNHFAFGGANAALILQRYL